MAYVVTLDDTRPAPRADNVPWTTAVIQESATATGSFTAIETLSLSPLDSDPANPATRDLTTNSATLLTGWYRVRFIDGDGNEAFTQPVFSGQPAANSVRALIPRVRRALEGPVDESALTDDQATAIVADAIAAIILFTGGLFGHELTVISWDASYGAPNQWDVDPALSEAEATVVVTQAALDYLLGALTTLKTSETIRDEGQEWSYQTSSGAIVERIRELRAARDRALAAVSVPVTHAFVSFLAERDAQTAVLIEPYVQGALLPSREGIW